MKLVFKQRMFSWFDCYDIYDEDGDTVFSVEGQLAWGHLLHIQDRRGTHVGTVKQVLFTLLPRYEIYFGEDEVGEISREWSFFGAKYNIDMNGWHVEGDFMQWEYEITDMNGNWVASVSKELWKLMDTYTLEIGREEDALFVLMLVLAIDADKERNS